MTEQTQEQGLWVNVRGIGFNVGTRVEDDDDREIVRLAMEMGERRRESQKEQTHTANTRI